MSDFERFSFLYSFRCMQATNVDEKMTFIFICPFYTLISWMFTKIGKSPKIKNLNIAYDLIEL